MSAKRGGTQHGGEKHGGTQHGGEKHGGEKHGGEKHGGEKHGGEKHAADVPALPPGSKWVTRRTIRVNRSATAWLIRRFVDPGAEILFVAPEEVARVQEAEGAFGFDAPGATFPHEDAKGRTSFEQIAFRYCFSDHALREMGRIVGAADLPARSGDRAEAAGLRAICQGFPLVAADDRETVERSAFLFDALYASVQARMRAEPE